MSPAAARWFCVLLIALFAAMVLDGLRTGAAWTRTGRDAARDRQPLAYWSCLLLQTAMLGACVWSMTQLQR